jgi:hypothetical protein
MAWTNPKKVVICLNCETEFSCSKVNKGLYCSGKCQQEYQRQKRVDEKTLTPRMLRRYLIDKYGEQCMLCGWEERNPITNNVPTELDHIDGNSENNLPENGRIICPNCHSLQSNFRALNKGNGRAWRMKRYKEGKSY